jgi:hypothetical protein
MMKGGYKPFEELKDEFLEHDSSQSKVRFRI